MDDKKIYSKPATEENTSLGSQEVRRVVKTWKAEFNAEKMQGHALWIQEHIYKVQTIGYRFGESQ